jgi:hypothetical protein
LEDLDAIVESENSLSTALDLDNVFNAVDGNKVINVR